MKLSRHRLGNRRGSVMVEFALGVIVLVPCFFATFQYGYMYYRYNALLAAVNAGARYASLAAYDSLSTTPSSAFSNSVKNVVVYGNPAGSGSPVISGLSTSAVDLAVTFTASSAGTDVPYYMSVSITSFTFPSLFSGQTLTGSAALFNTITLTGKPKIKYRYQGIYSPAAGGA